MALWKAFKGSSENLKDVELHEGYVYFCTDDGKLFFDYADAEGVLRRKQVGSNGSIDLEDLRNEISSQDIAVLHEAQEYAMNQSVVALSEAQAYTDKAIETAELGGIELPLTTGDGKNTLVQESDIANTAYGESSTALGYDTFAGAKGYYVSYVYIKDDATGGAIYLSKTQQVPTISNQDAGTIDSSFVTEYDVSAITGKPFTLVLNENFDAGSTSETLIYSVSNNKIVFTGKLINGDGYAISGSYIPADLGLEEVDDFSFMIPDFPNVGYAVVRNKATAMGKHTIALGIGSTAMGNLTIAAGKNSHAQGSKTSALGYCSTAEGQASTASGLSSHAEGAFTIASGNNAHAEGISSEAAGYAAHAEGWETKALEIGTHAEGCQTQATKYGAHSEGSNTLAAAPNSHVEGKGTKAETNQDGAHAEGWYTVAKNRAAHAEGEGTIASGWLQHVQGKYNIEDTASKYAHIVGGGGSENSRRNIHTLDWTGNAWFAGSVTAPNVYADNITNELNKKINIAPVSNINLIDENHKINSYYISDTILGQLKFGGTITSIDDSEANIIWHLSPSSLLYARIQELHPEHEGTWDDLYFYQYLEGSYNNIVLATWLPQGGQGYTSPVISDMRYFEGFYFILTVDSPTDIDTSRVPSFNVGDWWLFCDNKVQKIDNTDTITHIENANTSLLEINGSSGLELKHLSNTENAIVSNKAISVETQQGTTTIDAGTITAQTINIDNINVKNITINGKSLDEIIAEKVQAYIDQAILGGEW